MGIWVKYLPNSFTTNVCMLPEVIFKTFNLIPAVSYRLHVGQLCESIHVKPYEADSNEMLISPSISNALGLLEGLELDLWCKEDNIFLGPVVGVFVNPFYWAGIGKGYPPESARRHMQASLAANCLSYYFTIDNIDWVGKKIKGYTRLPGCDEWQYHWFSMPNVVYDRGVKFEECKKATAKYVREQLRLHPIHFVNSKDYLGKWLPFSKLALDHDLNRYLPKTSQYNGFSDALFMLKRFDLIFLKASYGSRGQGVLSIKKLSDQYAINFYNPDLQDFQELTVDIDELRHYVDNFTNGKPFVVQQGIKLLKYQGRKMDMRVLLEKNRQGQWQVIYNQCRIAKGHSTITNLACGGDILNYEDIYSTLISDQTAINFPTYKDIAEITIKLATALEKAFGCFGELGMDMAIDENGHVWFIEANTKPDKNPEPGLEDLDGVSPQFLAILEYAKFLVKGDYRHE